jgi:hypothetical protein
VLVAGAIIIGVGAVHSTATDAEWNGGIFEEFAGRVALATVLVF